MSDGWRKVSGPSPATPFFPRVISNSPSGLNFKISCPLPSGAAPNPTASVTQMLPSRSTCIPWGQRINPAPKLFSSLPDGSNKRIGSISSLSAQLF